MSAWSQKDERMYEHIRQSARDRGVREERAEEIASRTVNEQRRREGRTPDERTRGTGNPRERLEERTKVQLRNRAAELNIRGRSRMDKAELVRAIRAKER